MKLYLEIEIDLDAERERINAPKLYNKKQRKILHDITDAFEEGNMEKISEILSDKKNKECFDYPIMEYVCEEIDDVCYKLAIGHKITTAKYISEQYEKELK